LKKSLCWFLFLDAAFSILIFREVLWGKSLIAPFSLLPEFFSRYQYFNPGSPGPESKGFERQLLDDLPVQYTVHQEIQKGSFPWWDPYSFSGRPLAASGDFSAADPVRLLVYRFLSFESAWNYSHIIHVWILGLGMFLLLSALNTPPWLSVGLALSFQFAGLFVCSIGQPWFIGASSYLPILLVLWLRMEEPGWRNSFVIGSIFAACIFLAGNFRTHMVLVLLAFGFLISRYDGRKKTCAFLAAKVFGTLGCGAMIAAPVLLAHLDFVINSHLTSQPGFNLRSVVFLPALVGAIFPGTLTPWTSLRFEERFTDGIPSLHSINDLFLGSAGFCLLVFGLFFGAREGSRDPARRLGLMLLGVSILVLATPLGVVGGRAVLPLLMMGSILLISGAVQLLPLFSRIYRKTGWIVMTIVLVATLSSFFSTPMAVKQPVLILSLIGLSMFAWLLFYPLRRTPKTWCFLLGINFATVLLVVGSSFPREPRWSLNRLLDGSADHLRVSTALNLSSGRLFQEPGPSRDQLFPGNFMHFFRVRTVSGSGTLIPNSAFLLNSTDKQQRRHELADYLYSWKGEGTGLVTRLSRLASSRFIWARGEERSVRVIPEGNSHFQLKISDGPEAELVMTDPYDPGWAASVGKRSIECRRRPPFYTSLRVPAGAQLVSFRYRPAMFIPGMILLAVGLAALVVVRFVIKPGCPVEMGATLTAHPKPVRG